MTQKFGRTICYPGARCLANVSPQTSEAARRAADVKRQPEPGRLGLPSNLSSVFAVLITEEKKEERRPEAGRPPQGGWVTWGRLAKGQEGRRQEGKSYDIMGCY